MAQNQNVHELNTVVVTGKAESLTQSSIESAKENVKTIPGGASVVDLNQVREGRQSTWSDSLGLTPGVFIQDRFGSEEARISIRGSALSRTYHGFGTKVMQDGVPINYADGMFDMQTLDPNASRYVEVLRGPNATPYGATTLGGAINFVAPAGYTSPSFVGKAEAGSFGYNKIFSSMAGVAKPTQSGGNAWDYYVAGSQTQQDGFRQHAEMQNQKLLANFGVKANRDVESRFYVAAVRSRTQLPGYLTKAQLESTPNIRNSGAAFVHDNNQRRDVDSQRVANKTTVRDGNNVYEFAAYAMHYNLWHPISFGVIQQKVDTQGGHLKLTNTSGANQFTVAYLPSTGTTKGTSHAPHASGLVTGKPTSDYAQTSTNHTFFVEDKYRISDKTTLVGALQYDKANRKVSDVVAASNNYDHNFSQWSPRVGVTHDLTPQRQIFASVSRNFEAPIHGLAGTTTLATKAQSGTTFEVGTRGEATDDNSQYGWDATYYRTHLRNEFLSACVVAGCQSPTTTNVPKSMHQGVELGLSHLYANQIGSRMALLYSDFNFVGNAAYGNNQLPGLPPLLVRAESLYRFGAAINGKPSIYAGPKLEWVPRQAPMDNTNTVYRDGYALFGFKAGQAIDKTWSWFADARNLTNKRYAADSNISANLAGVNTAALYYPGDGRAFYFGIEAKFD
ncbi:TonB-dependent receptor [Limnohabitans sp.]|uniref:TonB-dependent receptor family protein n=1 Tax=Limnohabitans sp. TaxID=1907725 RepID=UPI00286F861C|nr:TonB-dependent receptor [Limnohabitans sp.]